MRSGAHLITELRDSFGRSTGYTYAKNGAVQQTVSTGYGADGRINSVGFVHGGEVKRFGYEYLPGSNLLHKLTKPNNMVLTQSYEPARDLLIGMAYHRGSSLVAQREYSYDALGRPTARNTARQGAVVNDIFAHNTRSELSSARVNGVSYGYAYDNIGNREFAVEGEKTSVYTANQLNQYTRIVEDDESLFLPEFDADGNQTRVQTSTGSWAVSYNNENRPTDFTAQDAEGNFTTVHCSYDYMGRRSYKKVISGGEVVLYQRYIYRGYLQIACIDLTRSHHPVMWLLLWDPTQPVATRPLAIQKDGTWRTYGLDLTKNVCEVYGSNGYINTAYTYTPFGEVTASGTVTQPIQWSSEFHDSELGMVYYNWRYYSSLMGRWFSRDSIFAENYFNDYTYSRNGVSKNIDILGKEVFLRAGVVDVKGGETAASLGIYHYWIKTDKKEAGLGNENGVPGENGQQNVDCIFSKTYIQDHTGREFLFEQKMENVVEDCVNAYLIIYSRVGNWIPIMSDCKSFATGGIKNCTPSKKAISVDPGIRMCMFGMIGGRTCNHITRYGVIYPNDKFVEITK